MSELTMPVGERDHSQGPNDAPLTLVEYGDYECPYCGEAYPIVKRLQKEMGKDLRFVFRNFPLTESHPHALDAAQAAEAAALQDKFWEMHDLLYENQDQLEDENLWRFGEQLGLDMIKFADDVISLEISARLAEDWRSAVWSGVKGTPTFFINGARHDASWDLPVVLATIERKLAARRAQSWTHRHASPDQQTGHRARACTQTLGRRVAGTSGSPFVGLRNDVLWFAYTP